MLMPGVQTVQESPSWLSNNGEVLNEDDKEEDNEGTDEDAGQDT